MANSLNTITVDGVTYDAEQYAKDHAVTNAKDELGKDVFLQLLVAQMKYQDPLNPQDNSQYLAELANFSALEQMTNVASSLEGLSTIVNNIDTSILVGQLSGMIGKNINWNAAISVPGVEGTVTRNEVLEGVVKGVSLADGSTPSVIAEVNGTTYKVSISDIIKVYEPDKNNSQSNDQGNDQADNQAEA